VGPDTGGYIDEFCDYLVDIGKQVDAGKELVKAPIFGGGSYVLVVIANNGDTARFVNARVCKNDLHWVVNRCKKGTEFRGGWTQTGSNDWKHEIKSYDGPL
jgi:hypothetical protein